MAEAAWRGLSTISRRAINHFPRKIDVAESSYVADHRHGVWPSPDPEHQQCARHAEYACLRRVSAVLSGVVDPSRFVLSNPAFRAAVEVPGWKLLLGRAASRVVPALTMANDVDPALISRDPSVVEAYRNDPLVHDRDPDPFAGGLHPHQDRPSRAVLHRVGQEIHQDLLEAKPVPGTFQRPNALQPQLGTSGRGGFAEVVRHLLHQGTEIEALRSQLQPARCDARDVQQPFDEQREPLRLAERPSQPAADARVVDTSELDVEDVVDEIEALVRERLPA